MTIKTPRGTQDVLPSEVYKWHFVEDIARKVAENYGFREIRTPIFEHTELFVRGIGDTTDVVEKEMYTFQDRRGRSITLKPEGTAPVVRAYIEHKLYAEMQPTKFYYITPVFRYEKPQAGRYREHHQFGIEVFGAIDPSVDAEVIGVAMDVYKAMGIENLEVRINNIGCPECRANYNNVLKKFLEEKFKHLCKTCQSRFDRNPMRIIDCKSETCQKQLQNVPLMLDYICDECNLHFKGLKKYLKALGIDYIVDPRIVRGLDYYTKTAFEIITDESGKKGTLCGGGRYDKLVEDCGGPPTPGVGFGMGLERLILSLETQGRKIPEAKKIDVFIVTMGDSAKVKAFQLLGKLRNFDFISDLDHMNRSTKAQFKYANKIGASFTIIIGDDELEKDTLIIRNMDNGEQKEIKSSEIIDCLKKNLGK